MSDKDKKYIDQIRNELKEMTKGVGNEAGRTSVNVAARGIGMHQSTVSLFLNGKYTGSNLDVAKAVEKWMERYRERRNTADVFQDTIDTFAVRKIRDVCRIAHIEGEMVVITGNAGVGKSRGVKQYVFENPDVILIQVAPYYTAKDVMAEIHKACGFSGEGRTTQMFQQSVERLKGSQRLIILDEAELLPYYAHEMIRRVHDLSEVGIALVGMPRLISNIRGRQGQYMQIYSRVAVHAEIPDLKDRQTDLMALLDSVLPDGNGVWKEFYKVTHNPRQLEMLLKRAIQIAKKNDREIDKEVIAKAKELIII